MSESDRQRLPIKLILPHQGHARPVPRGGQKPVPFREVDKKYREQLGNQVDALRKTVSSQIKRVGAAPVRVKLLSRALAKSHRPEQLFSEISCPIIGAGRLGELFIRGSSDGLARLSKIIEKNRSEKIVKELSAVESIEPITPQFRLGGQSALDILKRCPRRSNGFVTRVRLFDLQDEEYQSRLTDEFHSFCKGKGLSPSSEGYSPGSRIHAIECRSVGELEELSKLVGVRSISRMPIVRSVRPKAFNPQSLPSGLPVANPGDDVPVVVLVDSGVDNTLPSLNSWIVGRQSDVAPEYRNFEHGTFSAGLICWGSQLNPNLPGISSDPCGVLDLQILPNDDPDKGEIEQVTESEFLQSLEAWLKQYANKYKVWNLSLGTDEVCSLDSFSAFAEQLDNLQEQYGVTFVIAAGNYLDVPLLDFPRSGTQLDRGRITSPADSVLGITVGSVSHIDYAANGPKLNCPSAFSRHGAGPNHIIKPDLVHFGGTCSIDSSHVVGVRSVYGSGCAEDLGTSFATPLVSRGLAQIVHQMTPSPSPVLARALLTHHARDPRDGGRVPDGEENFFGFGLPAPPPYCLECSPHTATLVFEDVLRPGFFLEWDNFPYPRCLTRGGRYFGEIWMTIAFSPSRGARWGTEYCETHIDAHFGVYYEQRSKKTGAVSTKFKGLVPPEHKNPGLLYEAYQVENLRKWAPVRTYHGDLGQKGARGDRWRLMVRLLTRHGIEDHEAFRPQPFALIVTIADPTKRANVYDDVAQIVANRFQAQSLTLRTAAQVRVRT